MTAGATAIRLLGRLSIECAGDAGARRLLRVAGRSSSSPIWPPSTAATSAATSWRTRCGRRSCRTRGRPRCAASSATCGGRSRPAGSTPAQRARAHRRRVPAAPAARAVVDLDEARSALADAKARVGRRGRGGGGGARRGPRSSRGFRSCPATRATGSTACGVSWRASSPRPWSCRRARTCARATTRAAVARRRRGCVEAEPYSDAAHRLRIQTLVAAGDRGGALRAYEQCRTTFAEELGVEPSAETQAALRALDAMPAPWSPRPARRRHAAPPRSRRWPRCPCSSSTTTTSSAGPRSRCSAGSAWARWPRRPTGRGARAPRAVAAAGRDRLRHRHARHGRRRVHPPRRRAPARRRRDHRQRAGPQRAARRRGGRRGLRPAGARHDREAADRPPAVGAADRVPAPAPARGARDPERGRRPTSCAPHSTRTASDASFLPIVDLAARCRQRGADGRELARQPRA